MENPDDFEKDYVHDFYCNKSNDFSVTRQRIWPKIRDFYSNYVTDDMLILDSGCGNGRCVLKQNTICLDYSYNLLGDITKPCLSKIRSDILKLPFKSGVFDIITSIAVIHHLSTKDRRIMAIKEMRRVLKDKGLVLLYVWGRDVTHKKKFIQIKGDDYFATWDGGYKRYYYMYTLQDIEKDCTEAGFDVIESGHEQESIYVILKKK